MYRPCACCVAVVVAALQSHHAESNTEVVEKGLLAIGSLADGNAANQARLSELGACAGASAGVMSGLLAHKLDCWVG